MNIPSELKEQKIEQSMQEKMQIFMKRKLEILKRSEKQSRSGGEFTFMQNKIDSKTPNLTKTNLRVRNQPTINGN